MLLPRFGELGMFSFRGSAFIYCYGCYNPESSTSRADVPFLLLRVDCSLRFFDPTMACSNGNPPQNKHVGHVWGEKAAGYLSDGTDDEDPQGLVVDDEAFEESWTSTAGGTVGSFEGAVLLPRFGELGMLSFRGSAFLSCYGCYNPESSACRADVPFQLLRVDCSLRFFYPTMAC